MPTMRERVAELEARRAKAREMGGEEKIAKAAGCDDYVPKPCSPRELLAKIRQHLS